LKSIALIGSNGFVGNSIKKYILNKKDILLTCVTRDNYEEARCEKTYDILINAAMPSKRFWAKQNPYIDFKETVEKTFKIVNDWQSLKIIQISSISARSQLNTTYGSHKAAAEKLIDKKKNLILRLGPMYGKDLNKGVLIDMKNNDPVYISKKSLYCFAPIDWIGEWISQNMHLYGIFDLGGNNAVELDQIAKRIGSKSIFTGPIDDQVISKEIKNAPESINVIDFILK
tara:strand:+ start:3261 stop:3947 length:687 start_codon:yes stop_codon:yes gene_type:complete